MYAARHVEENPDKPAIVMAGSGEVVTFAEYEATANRFAHFLRDVGLCRRDHIALFMENDPHMLIAEGGAERTGLYYTCVNSYLSAEEVAYIVNDCEARVVVTSAAKTGVAAELPAMCPRVDRWLMIGTDGDPEGPYERWEDAIGGLPAEPVPDEQLGTPMLYSSGTTGRPKGILRPLPDAHPGDEQLAFARIITLWRFREGMVYLSPAPLYHSAPQMSVALTLRLGATAVVMEHFDPAEYLELIGRYHVTHTQVVPTMFSRLLKLPQGVREDAGLSSLEYVIHAAAPCPVPVKEQIIDWFGPVILEYYAATEGNGCTFCDSEQWLAHKGTVGFPILGEVLILDEEGHPRPTGTAGTVWFRGATHFEYFNDPLRTAEAKNAMGDASTVGDVGYLDEDGYLYLTDRQTHMIISGGVNVYPQEAENLLVTHPKVMDAAVIGVPDEDLGEAVMAVVQPMDGIEPGPDLERELIAFCRDHIAHFKCPRTVDFVDELPRLPTGKLYKRVLRDRYWAGHNSRIV
jgi:acyl-CoA synthetase (AMP-forming)/AMP-acid ligase II